MHPSPHEFIEEEQRDRRRHAHGKRHEPLIHDGVEELAVDLVATEDDADDRRHCRQRHYQELPQRSIQAGTSSLAYVPCCHDVVDYSPPLYDDTDVAEKTHCDWQDAEHA